MSGSHHALALAHWFSGDADESGSSFRAALALNPNDTESMADFGLRVAVLMKWDEAMPLVEESFRRNPCQATTFRMAFVFWHYRERRRKEALREVRLVGAPDIVYPHLAAAAAAAEFGRREEARVAVAEIERVAPGYGRRLVADHVSRNAHPILVQSLAASLRKAGLQGVAVGGEVKRIGRVGGGREAIS